MDDNSTRPQDQSIIGRDAGPAAPDGREIAAERAQGDQEVEAEPEQDPAQAVLDIEFESEIPEEGGEG